MNRRIKSSDPDILASLPALRRAARRARKRAQQTGTPIFVMRAGRVVNLNPSSKRPARRRKAEG